MSTNYDFLGAADANLMSAVVTLDPASSLFATADAAYAAWCGELGIDPDTSLGTFSADDAAFYFGSSVALDPGKDVAFKAHHMLASEGAIGFFDCDPANTVALALYVKCGFELLPMEGGLEGCTLCRLVLV